MKNHYLISVIKQLEYYKMLGEKAMQQLPEEALFWQYSAESNSIASLVKHIAGNMLSRFTEFLTTDGEKPWRDRDGEFENDWSTKAEVMECWKKGWACLDATLADLDDSQLEAMVYIRNDGHTVLEAINRQLTHYPYHIGQIVFIAKMLSDEKWVSLSIPRKQSETYNTRKFTQNKSKRHYTDDL